jgi:hypothetical protein
MAAGFEFCNKKAALERGFRGTACAGCYWIRRRSEFESEAISCQIFGARRHLLRVRRAYTTMMPLLFALVLRLRRSVQRLPIGGRSGRG